MSLLSRDLEIHLLPKNVLETILEPRRRLSKTLSCPQHKGFQYKGVGNFIQEVLKPRPATSTTSVAELDHTGPSPSYPSVSVRTVFLGVRRSDDVRRLAEEFFIDPTLRYLVSFLLRNLVGCNKKCSPRPFLWSPLPSF